MPFVRVGRLAVNRAFQGKGLGAAMLADAAPRAMSDNAAAYGLLVDAKNDAAARFYEHQGFIRLLSAPMTFFLPLDTLRLGKTNP